MANVLFCQPFAKKHMAEVAIASTATNLGAHHAVRAILQPDDSVGNLVVKSWPTAARMKLVVAGVQMQATTSAVVIARCFMVGQRPAARWLGAAFTQHVVRQRRLQLAPLGVACSNSAVLVTRQIAIAIEGLFLLVVGHSLP